MDGSARGQSDVAVQMTNDEASMSKSSCVRLGYFTDDYVRHFVSARRGGVKKYPPLINRGGAVHVQGCPCA
jgi:tRNA wybutosine-synthesizing protein 4